MLNVILTHPFSTIRTLERNAFKNMTVDSGGDYLRARGSWGWQVALVEIPGINFRTLILALVGTGILLVRRRIHLAMTVVVICMYYGFAGAFALDQGARIFYPAQIGWAILVAVTLVESFRHFRAKRMKLNTRVQAPTV
jgi:hypothetical protein